MTKEEADELVRAGWVRTTTNMGEDAGLQMLVTRAGDDGSGFNGRYVKCDHFGPHRQLHWSFGRRGSLKPIPESAWTKQMREQYVKARLKAAAGLT